MKSSVLLRVTFRAVLLVGLSACMSSCSPEKEIQQDAGASVRLGSDQNASALDIYQNELARTPPMGWNSWNAFHGDIDEQKIRGIVDAMVESGMRDAGYTYLVIDDSRARKRGQVTA